MSEVLLYAGTTEGRELAQRLSEAGVTCDVCVATEYGSEVMPKLPGIQVLVGRLDVDGMRALALGGYHAVVDATHPYATEASGNIRKSLQGTDIPYFRLMRKKAMRDLDGNIQVFDDNESCAKALSATKGNILLTTGSKELAAYCSDEGVRKRLFVRVLPGMESISKCEELGIRGRQMIAMQGPFSKEMNLALFRQFSIAILVTKESGVSGGFAEKLAAAQEAGIPVYVIGNPERDKGMSFREVTEELSGLLGKRINGNEKIEISLIGIGMGPEMLTLEAKQKLDEAQLVFGAPRMLEGLTAGKESYPYYRAEDIVPVLRKRQGKSSGGTLKASVLFSGDTGFYSGCEKIKTELKQAIHGEIKIYPGISSVSYLAAKVGISWHDASLLSIHGRTGKQGWESQLLTSVTYHEKTFLLVSDAADIKKCGELLTEAGLGHCTLVCGFSLSYSDEQICQMKAEEAGKMPDQGLCTCLILNSTVEQMPLVPGLCDDAFLREKVPMTKEEVREVCLCKLGLTEKAVVYDVGSGTGSIAVECALRSPDIRVYAIEQKPEALALLKRNLEKFHLHHVVPVAGTAPEVLQDLEMPTHVFVGGSSGRMEEILRCVWEKNVDARVVVTAVSLETISEVTRLLDVFSNFKERSLYTQTIQLQVSRARELGAYHLMQAENPVTIFCMRLLCDES